MTKVFIFCDDLRHQGRIVAVTNFQTVPGDATRWNEVYASAAAQGTRESGTTLEGDAIPEPGWTSDPLRGDRVFRSRYQLVCRKCKDAPLVAREENLFGTLTKLASAGVLQINLRGLAASLELHSESD